MYIFHDFFLWILVQPSSIHRRSLSIWSLLQHFAGACPNSPELLVMLISMYHFCASQLHLPWVPPSATAALRLASHPYEAQDCVQHSIYSLWWLHSIFNGKMTYLWAHENFWAWLSLPSSIKIGFLSSITKTSAKIWVPVTVATAFNFQSHYQTILPVPFSTHSVGIACFNLVSLPFKEDFIFLSTYFALILACISANHSWHFGLFFRKTLPQHFNRNYPLEMVSDSIYHCRQHHCYFPRYLYGKQLAPACTIWQINGIIKT